MIQKLLALPLLIACWVLMVGCGVIVTGAAVGAGVYTYMDGQLQRSRSRHRGVTRGEVAVLVSPLALAAALASAAGLTVCGAVQSCRGP